MNDQEFAQIGARLRELWLAMGEAARAFLAEWDRDVRQGMRRPRNLTLDEIEHLEELMRVFHSAQDWSDVNGDRAPERKAQLRLALKLVADAPSLLAAAKVGVVDVEHLRGAVEKLRRK